MSNSAPPAPSSKGGKKSDGFTKSGFILAAIGSSVGLGNMWKFPYITGKYGGAAFFLLFIICLIVVGLPILLAEMSIGRAGRANAASSLFNITGKKQWKWIGTIPVLTSFLIMCYYGVVAGWTLHYTVQSFGGGLYKPGTDYAATFTTFAGGYMPLLWQAVVMLLTGYIIVKGISGGIEKFNKVLIPGFLIILVVLMIRAVTLPGSYAGVEFFLAPDFSKLNTASALTALGHAFFSLSLGMGCMLTYGAYVQKEQSLGRAALAVGFGDLLYAFIAGMIIFPTIFSYGIASDSGVGLAFMALPAAFAQMPFGFVFGGLFFLLLAIAALTSCVSILEVPVAYAMNQWNWTRKKAAILTAAASFLIGVPAALSVGGVLGSFTLGEKSIFDLFDFVTSYIMMPIGGLIVTIFTGYAWKRAGEEAGISGPIYNVWMFLLRYVAPILIILIFLYSVGIINLGEE